jgi:predicted chitinase
VAGQYTTRGNYAKASDAFNIDSVQTPTLLEQSDHAAFVSAWWWLTLGCYELPARGDFIGLTRRINGSLTGLAGRRSCVLKASTRESFRRLIKYRTLNRKDLAKAGPFFGCTK